MHEGSPGGIVGRMQRGVGKVVRLTSKVRCDAQELLGWRRKQKQRAFRFNGRKYFSGDCLNDEDAV